MNIKKIQDAKLKGANVLVRVDFNVPFENGKINGDYKIKVSKETIDYILDKGGQVTLISHFGRPLVYHKENPGDEWQGRFSFKQLIPALEKILKKSILFVPSCHPNVIRRGFENLENKNIMLLENVRFYDGEKKNDMIFSRKISKNFDIFVNDAFSVCHREHASVVGIAKEISAYAGFQLQKEVANLERVKKYPEHPAVAIVGGAKIATKLPLINALEKNYDYILVGGKIANEAIDQGINFNKNVFLPVDFADKNRFDIGEKTLEKFTEIINQAETIVWNGPMGFFEKKPFDKGTRGILKAIIRNGGFSVMGGGESVEFLREEKSFDKISFVSTGGGAMLEYLSDEPMPGLEVLKK